MMSCFSEGWAVFLELGFDFTITTRMPLQQALLIGIYLEFENESQAMPESTDEVKLQLKNDAIIFLP